MFHRKLTLTFLAFFYTVLLTGSVLAQEKAIVIASTTSMKDSGLFEHLLPMFTEKTGIGAKVLSVGSGQAFDIARDGHADVVFTHAKPAEELFVAEGDGVKRYPVMYSEFVLIGPKSDPANTKGMTDVVHALKAIKDKPATFISRGDSSGTHMLELKLWNKDAGINIQQLEAPWYRSVARGMDATLHKALVHGGYTISDRPTWTHFQHKNDLQVMVEGDKRLSNQYAVILVNPAKHSKVRKELGQTFIDWLISREGQRAIANYKIDGRQMFFPNANDPNA